MRLVNATKLQKQIRENMMLSNMTDDFYRGAMWVLNQIYKFKREKDAVLVKHGHWVDCSNGWTCSVCEKDNTYDKPYCPHCGAKMDEEAEE